MKSAIKMALITMTMIASNVAFADSSDQPTNLDLAVAMEASRADLMAAQKEVGDRKPASEPESVNTNPITIDLDSDI